MRAAPQRRTRYWELRYDKGSHPNPVLAGDTLYAASKVIEKVDRDEPTGIVRFKLIGLRNERPATLMAAGLNLFEGKSDQKVFEIERSILLQNRTATSVLN